MKCNPLVLLGIVPAFAIAAAAGTPSDWRERLPKPVYDADPRLVDFYCKAWEIAHTRIDEVPGIPVPRYMDEAHRSDRIWIWDTCFMVHFCKYCPEEFPGIESLENFYGVMLADSEQPLPKVKGNRWCGADEGKMLDFRIHHPDNPPLFAWTEYAYALQTGDRARLEKVYSEKRWLQRWYELVESFDPAAPQPFGSVEKVMAKKTADGYRWGGCPSGMDNTPRGRTGAKDSGHPGRCPNNPDLLWIDAIAQQGLSALYLSRIADLLGKPDEAKAWLAKYKAAKDKVNALYWDETDGFYYDILASDRSKVKVMTPASFWNASQHPLNENAISRTTLEVRSALFEDPVWIDLVTGAIYRLPEPKKDDLGQLGVRFEGVPYYDAPVVITDRRLVMVI